MDEITRQAGAGAGQADEGDVFSYDLVPYHSLPFAGTHPNHLAAIATIFGMKPPAIETCRILEMACASGGNIIPMAAYLPGCEAVGIDLSARQIEEGEKTIKALGLKNIELRCHGIQDISAKLGKFDYIIAHGVYSWVTDDVRKKIVAVCKENLTENGVAYVSYNTYPGWHMPQALREMMLYHTAAFKDHKARVGQARAFLRFLFEATKSADNPYSAFLKAEVDYLGTKRDDYIFHEYLEKDNFPVYFHQFAEGARKAGLRYVADAEVATMLTEAFSENVAKTLRTAPNILQQEQYMDFLRNRRFRRSLLCHNGQPLDRNLKGERLKNLFVSAGAFPKGGGEAKPEADGKLTLTAGTGREVKIVYTPVLQAVLPLLWEAWPRALPFSKLMEAAKKALPKAAQGPGAIETQFGAALFRLYFGKVVGLTAFSPPAVSKAGAKPKATDLVRHQAKTMGAVTNLWHNQIRLGQVEAKLVEMLDGKTEKPAIVKALQKIVKATREAAIAKGQRVPPEPPSQDRLEQEVEKSLERLAHAALLIA